MQALRSRPGERRERGREGEGEKKHYVMETMTSGLIRRPGKSCLVWWVERERASRAVLQTTNTCSTWCTEAGWLGGWVVEAASVYEVQLSVTNPVIIIIAIIIIIITILLFVLLFSCYFRAYFMPKISFHAKEKILLF